MTLLPTLVAAVIAGSAPMDAADAMAAPPAVQTEAPVAGEAPCPALAPGGGDVRQMASPVEVDASAASPPAPATEPPAPGEIVVMADPGGRKADPLRGANAVSFAAVNKVDDVVVAPLARGYKHLLPEPARDGLHNALSNLTEPVVFANDLLQLHPGRAAKTLLRFVINSTVGLGGLFDVAKKKPFRIAHHNNGFADTLGYYGVKPGPYLYLPLIGPTTVRDMFGRTIDLSLLPFAVGAPFSKPQFTLPESAIKSLDDRLTFDARQRYLREETPDPYASERSYYLRIRANEIAGLHGKHPELSEQFGSPPPSPGTAAPALPVPPSCPQTP